MDMLDLEDVFPGTADAPVPVPVRKYVRSDGKLIKEEGVLVHPDKQVTIDLTVC